MPPNPLSCLKVKRRGWFQFISVQSLSCPAVCNFMDCGMPGLPVHHQLSELTKTHVHWVSDAIQPCHPLSSPSPPAFNLSQRQVFSDESVLPIRWPKYWSFSSNISPSSEHLGPISFMMDWLDLLAVQGALKSLLQHHFGYFGSKFAFPYKFKFFSSSSLEKPIFKNICDKRMISIFIKKLLRALGIIRIISPIEIRKM